MKSYQVGAEKENKGEKEKEERKTHTLFFYKLSLSFSLQQPASRLMMPSRAEPD